MAVTLSEAAAKQVKELKQAQNLPETVFLRMGVKGGGCSGMSYALEFDSEVGPHDKSFEIDGIKIVVDKKSYLYLKGTTPRTGHCAIRSPVSNTWSASKKGATRAKAPR